MKLKCLLFAALIMFCLSGCYGLTQKPPTFADPTNETQNSTLSEPTVSVLPATEAATLPETIPTEPALGIPAGAYPLRYENTENGAYMEYYAFIPENATENMPLVIFLHGDGEVNRFSSLENNSLMVSVREIYCDHFPFIAISPCTRIESWTDWPIPDTLMKLIAEAVETYAIDKDHIIITGHSRGAVGVWHMINNYGDYFSAAIPVSCFSFKNLQLDTIVHVPIRAFCGTLESYERSYSRLMGEQIDEIVLGGGDASLTVFEGASHSETPALSFTDELFQWALTK